jgi:hypothetical protein
MNLQGLFKQIPWQQVVDQISKFLSGSDKPVTVTVDPDPQAGTTQLNWADATCKITEHFTVGEAIALHAWNRLATEDDGLTDEVKAQIVKLCTIMESVRTLLNVPINTHCIFRSVKYNQEVLKSLPNDVHSFGQAVDFDSNPALTIQQVKDILEPKLESLNIRMEKGTTTWVHLDTHAVGPSGRYFTA